MNNPIKIYHILPKIVRFFSVTWEITEIAFAHLLPNFVECWWDAVVRVCLKIFVFTMYLCLNILDIGYFHLQRTRNLDWNEIMPTTGNEIL